MTMIKTVHQVAWHRNGIGGAGFHAVIFDRELKTCPTCGDEWGWEDGRGVISCRRMHVGPPISTGIRMLGVVFDEPNHVAIFEIGKLADPAIGVAFGENSWRGDRFERELRQAIADHDSDGSVRVGPFGIPVAR